MDDAILEDKQTRWVPWLIAVTALAAIYAIAVAWSGGFTVRLGGVRMRSHSWLRPALVAVGGAAVLVYFARAQVTALVARASSALQSVRSATVLAAGAAAWAFMAGAAFGTFAIGGADSYGYVGQARLLAQGRLTDTVPVSPDYNWPDAAATFAPLGFTPGLTPGVIAPKYPPGLPLLMAPLTLMSERAVYFLVPCFAALLVWTTFRLGAAIGDPFAGALAALLLSISPTFLYQAVQPMSDVPAAACWLAAVLVASRATRASAAASGLIASVAVLIRPNLAPALAIVLAVAVFSPDHPHPRNSRSRVHRAAAFTIALIPALIVLGWIQSVRYGSPAASGYGSVSDAFALGYVRENLARYPQWLTETHTWFIWMSLGAPLWIARRAARPLLAWAALALAGVVWASYLPYLYFHPEEWFYTRFLLPAIAVMLLFASACSIWLLQRTPVVIRAAAIVSLSVLLVVHGIRIARTRGAFDIRHQERKYPLAGAFVRDHLPPNAIVLAGQHSGSIRYYAGRATFRWDVLSPTRLDQALATFRAQGYQPFLVVDGGEYDDFKQRFDPTHQRASQRATLLAILGDARIYALE
jgi:hypothetical protein